MINTTLNILENIYNASLINNDYDDDDSDEESEYDDNVAYDDDGIDDELLFCLTWLFMLGTQLIIFTLISIILYIK